MTDLRTGAAGAVAVKYTTPDDDSNIIGFIGTGAIARNMARAAAIVRPNFTGVAYGLDVDGAKTFADEMSAELGVKFSVASSSEELCGQSNVIFTQTTGSNHVLKLEHLRKGTTIIASGSDQPTKQELPNNVLASADKYVADLINQTSRVGGEYRLLECIFGVLLLFIANSTHITPPFLSKRIAWGNRSERYDDRRCLCRTW